LPPTIVAALIEQSSLIAMSLVTIIRYRDIDSATTFIDRRTNALQR